MNIYKLNYNHTKIAVYIFAVLVAAMVGYLSAKSSHLLLGAIVLSLFFMIPNRYLLTLCFVSSQLIYVVPSIISIGGFEVRVSDPFIAILLIKTLPNIIFKSKHQKITLSLIVIFLLSCFISLLKGAMIFPPEWNFSQYTTLVRWLLPCILFLVMPYILTKEKELVSFSKIIVISIIVQAMFSLMNFMNSDNTIRAANNSGNIADYAVILVLLIAIIYSFISNSYGKKSSNYLLLAFLISSLFLTFTRAAVIAFLVVTILYLFKSKGFAPKIIFIYVAILGFPLLLFNFRSIFEQRFITDIASGTGSFNERSGLLFTSFQGIADDPLLGKGWSSFRFWHSGGHTEIHSGFAQITFDNGVIGLLVFLMLLFHFAGVLKENAMKVESIYLKSVSTGIYHWYIGIFIWLFMNQLLPGTLSLLYFWATLGLAFSININLVKNRNISTR